MIGSYAAVGVHNMLALRGDPPGDDPLAEWIAHPRGLTYASELVRLAKSLGTFSVGVAGFPDKHPRSPDVDTDVLRWRRRSRPAPTTPSPRCCSRPTTTSSFRDRLAAQGIDVPILPGHHAGHLHRPAGADLRAVRSAYPADLAERLDAVAGDPAAGREIGLAHAIAMCQRPARRGRAGPALLHVQPVDMTFGSSPRWASGRRCALSGAVRRSALRSTPATG